MILKKILILFVVACLLFGCVLVPKQEYTVQHIVLLWLKPDIAERKKQEIIEGTNALIEINQVKRVTIGHSIPSDRNIVDDSFDLGVLFEFETVDAMKNYTKDPLHKAFVEKSIKGNIEKIIVYDFEK